MPRLLITDRLPRPPAEVAENCLVIAPDPRSFRNISVPSTTLYQVAKESLKANGFGIATPIKSAEALRSAVHRVLPDADSGAVSRHHRETIAAILRSGIDTKKLASVGSERARNAALISNEYIQILKRSRLVDRDAVFAEAVRHNSVKPQKVLIYGYFRARQLPARSEEIEFIDKVAADGSIFFLPCGDEPIFAAARDWVQLLIGRGWEATSSPAIQNESMSQVSKLAMRFASGVVDDDDQFSDQFDAFGYASLDKEVHGTLARAKAAVFADVAVDRIVIACRDIRTYVRSLIAVGHEYNVPLDIDHNVPIAETAFGELISLIFETIDPAGDQEADAEVQAGRRGFQYEPTIRLLMHRLGPGLVQNARVEAYRSLPAGFDRWKQVDSEVEFLNISGKRSSSEWSKWLNDLTSRWDVRGAKKLGTSAADVEAHDRFFRSLEQLSVERGSEPIDLAKFAADISDILLNVSTPIHTEKGGIKVRQPNEIVGGRFDAMFIVGLAEGMLPAAAVDSNVIDLFECEELRAHGIHFQNALEVPRWEAITFYFMLLACRGQVTLSYPLFAGDSERLKSSYFKRLGIIPRKPDTRFVSGVPEFRQAFLLDGEPSQDEVLTYAKHQYKVEERRESGQPPDEYDGVIGTPVVRNSWSSSSLGKIGSCPFKWFASDLLRLRTLEESDTDLPPSTRGNLLHKTLEIAVGRSIGAADLRSAVYDALESAFAEAEELDDSLTLITNWQLRRVEQIEKLGIAVASEHFVLDGANVVEVEKPFEAKFCSLTIKGTIDRIDQLADGSMLALDYKHGSYLTKVKDEDGFLNLEIQLPLYSMVALPQLYPDKRSSGRFFHLSDPKKTEAKEIDLIGFISRVKTLLDTGNFAVDPDQQRCACEYCEFDVVCRVGPRLDRRANKA